MSNETKTIPNSTSCTTAQPAMVKKIGNITYRVWAHFSETSTETMEDKIKRMLQNEVRQLMESE